MAKARANQRRRSRGGAGAGRGRRGAGAETEQGKGAGAEKETGTRAGTSMTGIKRGTEEEGTGTAEGTEVGRGDLVRGTGTELYLSAEADWTSSETDEESMRTQDGAVVGRGAGRGGTDEGSVGGNAICEDGSTSSIESAGCDLDYNL